MVLLVTSMVMGRATRRARQRVDHRLERGATEPHVALVEGVDIWSKRPVMAVLIACSLPAPAGRARR
jgi:hypothetical protein